MYSDRTEGPKPRDIEALPKETKQALLGLVRRKIKATGSPQTFPKSAKTARALQGQICLVCKQISTALSPVLTILWSVKQTRIYQK